MLGNLEGEVKAKMDKVYFYIYQAKELENSGSKRGRELARRDLTDAVQSMENVLDMVKKVSKSYSELVR